MMNRRSLLTLVALAGVAPLTACSSDAPSPANEGPPANGAELTADAFATAMTAPKTVLLDVRTPEEFAAGHLQGATNIDLNGGNFEALVGALDTSVPYALYCRSGNRSGTALGIMKGLGFTSTYHLGGGIGAWTQSGRALVQ